jgi:hypothetical protein
MEFSLPPFPKVPQYLSKMWNSLKLKPFAFARWIQETGSSYEKVDR